MAPVVPPVGFLFEQVSAPLDIDTQKTTLGVKTGEASSVGILGLIAFGDCSIASAAKNGNLSEINHADYKFLNVLGVFQQFTVTAYGN